jgi:hypothetical protein
LIKKYPSLNEYLAPNATVVGDIDFETGLVNIMKLKANFPVAITLG